MNIVYEKVVALFLLVFVVLRVWHGVKGDESPKESRTAVSGEGRRDPENHFPNDTHSGSGARRTERRV